MSQENLAPGDFLVFQLESGFALLRVLAIDKIGNAKVWHLAAYQDFFEDIETAENATRASEGLTVSEPHLALTDRAFESTQVAKISAVALTEQDVHSLNEWRNDPHHKVSDRSVRLMLGLR